MAEVRGTPEAARALERLRERHGALVLHRRLGSPDFLLDVVPGREDTFSLEGADDVHFTTRVRPVPGSAPGP